MRGRITLCEASLHNSWVHSDIHPLCFTSWVILLFNVRSLIIAHGIISRKCHYSSLAVGLSFTVSHYWPAPDNTDLTVNTWGYKEARASAGYSTNFNWNKNVCYFLTFFFFACSVALFIKPFLLTSLSLDVHACNWRWWLIHLVEFLSWMRLLWHSSWFFLFAIHVGPLRHFLILFFFFFGITFILIS